MTDTDEDQRYQTALAGSPEALQIYNGWRGLGYPPHKALLEVKRAGAWADPHDTHRYLRRSSAFWVARLGNRGSALDGFRNDLATAGRLLADWQLLTQEEIDWLQGLADGTSVDLKLGQDDAKEILRVGAESAKDLTKWLKLNQQRTGRGGLAEDQRAIAYWWRSTPHTHQLSASASHGTGWPTGRERG